MARSLRRRTERNIRSEGLAARKAEKKKENRKRRRKTFAAVLIVLLLVVSVYGRNIIKLRSENADLRKQQEELQEEREKLKKQIEEAGTKEYIQEEARKQLRMLNQGEILFLFNEDEEETEEAEDE